MNAIASDVTRLRLDAGPVDAGFWLAVATQVAQWCTAQHVNPRDAIVLLPYAGLLPPAREAFARQGGWQPRVETTRTLALSLAPPTATAPGQIDSDPITDRLSAGALLRGQAAGAAWAKRDARAFDAAVVALVDTAHALLRGAHERRPEARGDFWRACREALAPVSGPGSSERWLARIALEWAAANDAPAQDALWQQRPAAWIGVQAGGHDALAAALLAAAGERGRPVLWFDADPPAAAPFDGAAHMPPPRRWLCDGLEGEAQAAALAVLEALDRGQAPVALIAQDRVVVRRIRALLDRAQVPLRDETGWTLSTTRAAARLMAMLRAADPAAGRDTLLDALKAERGDEAALLALEASWRKASEPAAAAQDLWQRARATFQVLRHGGRRPLVDWLAALAAAAPALLRSLAEDAAGAPLLAALHLDGRSPDSAWHAAAAGTLVDLAGFTDWIDATFEATNFVPPGDATAPVVITPLASALLRPFAAVVLPGCDNQRLGAASMAPGLLSGTVPGALGLPDARQQRERERMAFAQILRAPHLTLLRRRNDEGELLAPSLLVDHAWQARRRLAQPAPDETPAPLPQQAVALTPSTRPAPTASQALPARLSASSVEALRACPYRFFAQTLLGLKESAELDADLEKRDYGTWLHGVLLRFHATRPDADAAATDAARLLAAADAEQASLGLDAAQLLPFRAAFESFAANYLAWLHERDAAGWRYEAGELALQRDDPLLAGVRLDGRIDRVDVHAGSGTRQVIDYKTGNVRALKDKVAEPLEDTQLAFYAALLGNDHPVHAIYLALDERRAPQPIEHPDVAASAERLVVGLAHDLARLRAGAGMPALGEGTVCEHCDARGLCRRDHWTSEAGA
jgi:ATP-dependent helicase/nuclease subunit B